MLSALLVGLGGVPAVASSTGSSSSGGATPSYTWLTCTGTTGELLDVTVDDPLDPIYTVTYTITPCQPWSPTKVYALAVYGADGSTWGEQARYWSSPTVGSLSPVLPPSAVAVCLIASPVLRLACAGIVWSSEGVVLEPLAVDAPAVSFPVNVAHLLPPADGPVCPTCLR
jgi:hypothetical protein